MATEEAILLDHAIHEVEHAVSAKVYDDNEVAYMRSLTCSTGGTGTATGLDLLQSIFYSISLWCDSKLQDYHLYFIQVICFRNLPEPPSFASSFVIAIFEAVLFQILFLKGSLFQKPSSFEKVLTMGLSTGTQDCVAHGNIQVKILQTY